MSRCLQVPRDFLERLDLLLGHIVRGALQSAADKRDAGTARELRPAGPAAKALVLEPHQQLQRHSGFDDVASRYR